MLSTVPLLLQTIFDEAMKTEEGQSLTLERVRAALVQLGCELPTIAINETYSIGTLSLTHYINGRKRHMPFLKS